MRTTVAIARCGSYEPDGLRQGLLEALAPLGGMAAFVKPGQRVLLKPNFVLPREAAEAANTHPALIQAVADLVREAGGRPLVGDSPALGSARAVAAKLGLNVGDNDDHELPLVEFTKPVRVDSPELTRTVWLAREVAEADVVINLPKLKVHGQLRMTCAVKNLFGCVKGRRKALLHYARGSSERRFADMLLDTMLAVRPTLTIVDAITVMERWGPTNGDPLEWGLLLAGVDCPAIDTVAFELAGIQPQTVATHAAACRRSIGVTERANIDIAGPSLDELERPPLVPAHPLIPIRFSLAHVVRGLWRQLKQLRLRPAGR